MVRDLTDTTAKQKDHMRKQDDFSRRIHKQHLMTNLQKAGNSDLRINAVTGVDKSHNVWHELANMNKVIRIHGICHQEIGRMVTSTKSSSKPLDENLFESMQKQMKGKVGQAMFNLNRTLQKPSEHENYITAHRRFKDERGSFFSHADVVKQNRFTVPNRVGSMDYVSNNKRLFPFDVSNYRQPEPDIMSGIQNDEVGKLIRL